MGTNHIPSCVLLLSVGIVMSNTEAGRFPENEIVSLLNVNRRYNLAESTSKDLTVAELFDLLGDRGELDELRLGYGSSAGLPELRELIAEDHDMDPSQILVTTGTALGLYLIAVELCAIGDEAVIVTPCFPPARDALISTGVRLLECRLSFEDGYRLSASRLEPYLSEKTTLVSVASPQNPSGVSTSLDELREIVAVMQKTCPKARLFVDETYRKASYGEDSVAPSAAGLHDSIITGSSISKAHGAPGLRVGWLTCAQPDLMNRCARGKMNTVISGSPLNEKLAAALLSKEEEVLRPRREQLAHTRAMVSAWFASLHGLVEWVPPDAGALCAGRFCVARFSAEAVDRIWQTLEHELQLASGVWFGESWRSFRLGFGYLEPNLLGEALDRLRAVVRESAL